MLFWNVTEMTVKGFSIKGEGNTGENTKCGQLENVTAVGNLTADARTLTPKLPTADMIYNQNPQRGSLCYPERSEEEPIRKMTGKVVKTQPGSGCPSPQAPRHLRSPTTDKHVLERVTQGTWPQRLPQSGPDTFLTTGRLRARTPLCPNPTPECWRPGYHSLGRRHTASSLGILIWPAQGKCLQMPTFKVKFPKWTSSQITP